jgi:diguanylate cyclase (GGDEF)-like protein/PAS domain S-box-containing protein/putative nucleotidyltransferase with HDIG domain
VVAAILAATVIATVAALVHERDQARDERAEATGPVVRALASDAAALAAGLEDLRALLESNGDVPAETFRRFVAAPLGRDAALASVVSGAALPDGSLRAVHREPRDAAGADAEAALATEQALEALRRARDDAAPRMSAPIDGATPSERLLVMAAPVYAPGATIATAEQRRAALRGYVAGVARAAALGEQARAALPQGARLSVTDDGVPLVGGAAAGGDPQGTIDVQGRRWSVAVAGVGGTSLAFPLSVAIGGAILAAAVGLLFVQSGRRERDALALAVQRGAESSLARSELERLQVRHELILSSAGDGIIGVDPEGRATFVNPAAARMLGWSVEELTGRRVGALVPPGFRSALDDGRVTSGEGVFRRRDGSSFPGEHTTTPLVEDGVALGAVMTFRDVTARKRLEAQTARTLAAAEERAAVDPLTGLANHRTFHERLRTEVERARRRERGLSLVLMDLDHFKRVNDLHGHQTGDRVLERAARVLAAQTRAGELVARVGGEEFAMILPEAGQEEALRAAERVREAIEATDFPEVGPMTMSAGVCDLARAGDADGLYRLADGALYWAKHQGRNVVLPYSPELADAISAREQAERVEREQALVSIRLLARVVDAKNPATRRHSERVAELCSRIADALGWAPERVALLRDAALVHDVGKVGVPAPILLKPPEPLEPGERKALEEHAELGARIVAEVLTPEQVSWVRGHHERWDASGYPDGLAAEEIPDGARIMAIADAWDVMTSDRHTPAPLSPDDAVAEIRRLAGERFWPDGVAALVAVLGPGR